MRTVIVAVLTAISTGVLGAGVIDMCKDETKTRIGRLPNFLLKLATYWIPEGDRPEFADEWEAELAFILQETEGLPVTRLIRGLAYTGSLLVRGAPQIARYVRAETALAGRPARRKDTPWADLFPDGRQIYYEGDDPDEFRKEIKARFGFDPALDPCWGEEPGWGSYSFHCPVGLLDDIYGGPNYPMGS
ncbi:hypothetical protein [Actinoplanes sp. NPDC049118]|uniref:hypothetical protein n=1 Tax=Actinoplanes sp. NPDC049118 TaxID=3155769 RepID=UPI00340C4B4F